jgi:hypothetical protein
MEGMRFTLQLAIWATCAITFGISCSDPSLRVELILPDEVRDKVRSATLSVLVPPQGDPFGCEELAFGAVDSNLILASSVEEVVLRSGSSGDLNAIPREGDKVLLASAIDTGGEKIVAGCAEQGLIEGDASITINGELVTIAILPAFNPIDVAGRTTEVRITDVEGQPARGIEVRWTRTAPGAAPESNQAVSDGQGLVAVDVTPPPLPGPLAVDVNARWARSEPPVIVGFRNPETLFTDTLPNPSDTASRNPDEIYQVGRIGPNGEMGVAALGNPDLTATRQAYIAYYNPAISGFTTVLSDPMPAAVSSLALITEGNRDRIFTVSLTASIEILPSGALVVQPLGQTIPIVRRFLPLGDCTDPTDIQGTLAVFLDGGSQGFDAAGAIVASPFGGAGAPGMPLTSGCLSSEGELHRTVTYLSDQAITLMADLDVIRRGTLAVVSSGMGYTQATGGEEALLLATTLNVEGTDIGRFRLLPVGADKLNVELVTSDSTITFAQSTASGDFDGDGVTDIAAVLVFGDTAEATEYRIHISLGLEAATGRVAGVSSLRSGLRPRIFVRDFDADGHDDILIGSNGSFEILSMGPFD